MKEGKKIITALKKARTHLDTVIKMVKDDRYCVNILQQNLAVIGLLKSANGKLLDKHLNSCFGEVMKGKNKRKKKRMINEILKINESTT